MKRVMMDLRVPVRRMTGRLGLLFLGLFALLQSEADETTQPVDVANDLQVMWDDAVLDLRRTTAAEVLHAPQFADVVMEHDEPWEGDGSDYHNIFFDGGKWRMYYLGLSIPVPHATPSKFKPSGVRVCYAESADGLRWTKPKLGLREFGGSKENNIILDATDHPNLDNFFVFRDENPACPPDERYKGVCSMDIPASAGDEDDPAIRVGTKTKTVDGKKVTEKFVRSLWFYVSADGLSFRKGWCLTKKGIFDTLNIIYWDRRLGQYVGYVRGYHKPGSKVSAESADAVRDIRRMTSADGRNWSDPVFIDFGAGTEDYPLYTNVLEPYFRNPKLLVGFPSRYVERKAWTANFDRLPGAAERKARMKAHPRYGLTTTDCIFICSRDGKHFRRFDEAFVRPGPEGDRNWVYGDCYPARGLVTTPGRNGSADVISMYMFTGHWSGGSETLDRYTIRQDGFVSRRAPYAGAVVATKPIVFKGRRMQINFSTSARGHLFVTVRGDDGRSLRSIEMFGDQVDCPVPFEAGELAEFAGRPVVLELEMSDADLYSFRFVD